MLYRNDLHHVTDNCAKISFPQRQREEIEMQMADENLKHKEVLLEMKAFDGLEISSNTSMSHHVPLAKKYENILMKLGEQRKKFRAELCQVKLICVHFISILWVYIIDLRHFVEQKCWRRESENIES